MLRPPRLIGREAEWRALAAAWNAGGAALVLGEPGIGKSRLLADFCAAHGEAVFAAARPGDAVVPYTFLARVVRALLEVRGAPDTSWVRSVDRKNNAARAARHARELPRPQSGQPRHPDRRRPRAPITPR